MENSSNNPLPVQPDRFQHIQVRYSKPAIISLSLGFVSLIPLFGFFFAFVAIILGAIALLSIKNDKYLGKWQAITGILLGFLGIFISVGFLSYIISSPDKEMRGVMGDMQKIMTSTQLQSCAGAIEVYKKMNGQYPDNLQQISEAGQMPAPTKDGYQREFYYKPSSDKKDYEIRSLGADGIYGTLDDITLKDNFLKNGERLDVLKDFKLQKTETLPSSIKVPLLAP